MRFLLFLLSILQGFVEFFGWWMVFAAAWYGVKNDLGGAAPVCTVLGALVCFVGIRILMNRLW